MTRMSGKLVGIIHVLTLVQVRFPIKDVILLAMIGFRVTQLV